MDNAPIPSSPPNPDADAFIARMLGKGVPAGQVASLLDIPVDYVRTISFGRELQTNEPVELGEAMLDLGWRAYWEARNILEEGSFPAKLALIRTIYTRTAAYMKGTTPATFDDLRAELRSLIESPPVDRSTDEDMEGGIDDIKTDEPNPLDREAYYH